MARVRLSPGRSRPKTESGVSWLGRRARAVDAALTAAGAPGLLPTYEMTQGNHAGRLFAEAVMDAGFSVVDRAAWPFDGATSADEIDATAVFREGGSAIYRLEDGTIALFSVDYGWAHLSVASGSEDAVRSATSMFQALYPATYLDATDDRVPVTFWSLGPHGPIQRLRMIDASPWETIRRNYAAAVADDLDQLMSGFEPGKGGLLLLWQGPPGTGKTWALRALVSEWLPWAEFHYITDPDAFFVEEASYMIDVLLADSYEALSVDGDVYSEADELGKWRVLILEDTGELLSAGAKEKYGQGLSRLLNVVDGLIGQGLRVLVLVTTNDELGELNPAVRRAGRCASQIEFVPMTAEETAAWLGVEEAEEGVTLADLYARAGDARDALEEETDDLTASADEDDLELARLVALAAEPLVLEAAAARPGPLHPAVAEAIRALTATHDRTVEGIGALVASANAEEAVSRGDEFALKTLEILREVATRPDPVAPAQGDIHVHVPRQDLSVHLEAPPAPNVHVHPPEIPAPVVHLTARMPEQKAAEAAPPPEIHVHVPEQPAPNVHVDVAAPVVEAPPARVIRVEYDAETGEKLFVPYDDEERQPPVAESATTHRVPEETEVG